MNTQVQSNDPTPEQIARRCEQIRRTWHPNRLAQDEQNRGVATPEIRSLGPNVDTRENIGGEM